MGKCCRVVGMWFKIGGSVITGLEKGCRGGGHLRPGWDWESVVRSWIRVL